MGLEAEDLDLGQTQVFHFTCFFICAINLLLVLFLPVQTVLCIIVKATLILYLQLIKWTVR